MYLNHAEILYFKTSNYKLTKTTRNIFCSKASDTNLVAFKGGGLVNLIYPIPI